jgi:hypothetical protein
MTNHEKAAAAMDRQRVEALIARLCAQGACRDLLLATPFG